jgi:hypothetical protein
MVPWCIALGGGLAGCTVPSLEELENERTVKVEVSFNFKAGCIKVQAVDTENPGTNRDQVAIDVWMRQATNRMATVAFFPNGSWSRTLNIIATAHERNCDGPQVATDNRQITLDRAGPRDLKLALAATDTDGDGYIAPSNGGTDCDDAAQTGAQSFPGATEVCDLRDNDCDNRTDEGLPRFEVFVDGDRDGVGTDAPTLNCATPPGYAAASGDCDDGDASRTPGKTEVCDNKDNNCVDGVDEGFDKNWYLDADNDGAQGEATLVTQCDSPGAGYARRNAQPFDCADNDPARTPGKPELCDGVDNNCVNGVDEPFPNKGQTCSNDVCTGRFVCNTAQNNTVCDAPAPVSYYPDVDRDGEGAAGSSGTKVCAPAMPPAGTVANATDCDDVDPGTRVGGAEVCDGLDNNCNTQSDENLSCGGVFRRVFDGALGGNGHDWRTVAVGPNGYPVWVAGLAGKLARRTNASTPFESHGFGEFPDNTTNCGDYDWHVAWVRPSDGHLFLAGEGGRVAQHTGTACINQSDAQGSANVVGMTGLETGTGTTLYLVSEDGRLHIWVPGNVPAERHNVGGVYRGIHALDSNLLLVAGGQGGSLGNQLIAAYVNGTLTARNLHTLSTSAIGNANAVWMGTPNLAYAVGDGGRVWRWNGATNWSLVTTPPVPIVDFTSVVMQPGADVAYMVDRGTPGRLRRLTQYGWARAPLVNPQTDLDVPLYDIAMTSTGGRLEYWMVGDDGRVYHYPE